ASANSCPAPPKRSASTLGIPCRTSGAPPTTSARSTSSSRTGPSPWRRTTPAAATSASTAGCRPSRRPVITSSAYTATTAPSAATERPDGFDRLLKILPLWIAEAIEAEADTIEEVAIDLGRPLQTKAGEDHRAHDQFVTRDDLHYVVHRIEGFRSDNRTGIDGTLHRLSAVRDRYDEIIGITVRVGRFVSGIAEPLRSALESRESLMIIGPPGVGKTTLLRDVSRIL